MAVDSIDTTGTLVLTAGATEYADALISAAWIMAEGVTHAYGGPRLQ